MGVLQIRYRATVIESKDKTLTITTFLFLAIKVLRAAISFEMNDVFSRSSYFQFGGCLFPKFPKLSSSGFSRLRPGFTRKTYSSSSNSFGIVPLALPTLSRTMSSPDHPTSNLEDAFSSNFPNYLPLASPDYVPASPGKLTLALPTHLELSL
nr:hypothetical protein [Tanacetum cinerariifolium]